MLKMGLEPTTDCGKRLQRLLQTWLPEASDNAQELLCRAFNMYALKLENQKEFLRDLDRQEVLDKRDRLSQVHKRNHYAIQ